MLGPTAVKRTYKTRWTRYSAWQNCLLYMSTKHVLNSILAFRRDIFRMSQTLQKNTLVNPNQNGQGWKWPCRVGSLNALKCFSFLIYDLQIIWKKGLQGTYFFWPFWTGVSKGPFSGGLNNQVDNISNCKSKCSTTREKIWVHVFKI